MRTQSHEKNLKEKREERRRNKMVRIKYWLNKETTLTVGKQVYHGRLIYDYLNGNGPESKNHNPRYVFKTDHGQRISTSHAKLRVKEGGLVLRTRQ